MRNNEPPVAVVVLNWNDWEQTIECLESVFQINYNNFNVILVDNNSDDYHLDKIIEWSQNNIKVNHKLIQFNKNKNIKIKIIEENNFEKVEQNNLLIIKNKINKGCTGGFNTGYRYAINCNYKYIARFDNDTIAAKNHLQVLIDQLEKNESIAAICAKANYKQMPDKVSWAGMRIKNNLKFHRMMRINKRRDPDEMWTGIIESDAVNGPGSVYRCNLLKLTGLADEDFFYGPEDVELSQRLRRYGKIIVNCNVKVFHEVAKSATISGIKKRTYMEHKSFLILIKKIGSFSDKLIGYSYGFLRLFFYLLLSFKSEFRLRLFSSSNAFFDFILKRYGEYDKNKINSEKFLN